MSMRRVTNSRSGIAGSDGFFLGREGLVFLAEFLDFLLLCSHDGFLLGFGSQSGLGFGFFH